MKALSSALGTDLYWVQPRGLNARRFQLRTGDEVLATLQFKKPFDSLAAAESADGSWLFRRAGFLRPRVFVREVGKETDLATYVPNWIGTKGKLEFNDGRVFGWRQVGLWLTQCQFENVRGHPLIVFRSDLDRSTVPGLFRTEALVQIDPNARTLAALSLLVVLGWYLIVLKQDDPALEFRL
jgi:hypothetical protein